MSIKLGYVIAYVQDVERTIGFYERAFGLTRRFVAEGADYGELDTGATVLAFASEALGDAHHPDGYARTRPDGEPRAFEIALVTDDVQVAVDAALREGASMLKAPELQPWGQTVAWLRDPDGLTMEICTPVPG